MPKSERKGGKVRTLLAVVLGAAAAKVALKGAEKLWTSGFRQDLPGTSEQESIAKKAAWVALSAALVGVARELVRDLAAPKVEPEPA
jgi:hypothetical protein